MRRLTPNSRYILKSRPKDSLRQLMTSLRTRREPKDNFHPTSEPRTDIAYTIIYLMASYLQDETGAEKASSPTGFTRLSIRVLPSFCFLRLLALSASPPLMLTLTLSGSPIRQKGRSFFLKTNHVFLYEIMEEMASCINDSQWRIGAFLTNSCSSPKKIRSRKKKINLGLNQEPDCVVILDADRKSSVILEADRSQIPIASLVDSTIPLGSFKRITYPIPANDPIQFVYLFRHSITKTVILERGRIVAMKEKKELIDRPFPRRIGFSRSVEWSPASETSLWIEQE
ncbi:Ribosomal protein S2, mitochondrial [Ananas comosus]|uniref:Ribosomal protein S2, mitochondrial n=1 Tax=Ananas comosus TaxID=4615 RepID=A0A199VRN3_ANACO|nr:Ribosomal protein S2, mitochondrial [Ananas comosus]